MAAYAQDLRACGLRLRLRLRRRKLGQRRRRRFVHLRLRLRLGLGLGGCAAEGDAVSPGEPSLRCALDLQTPSVSTPQPSEKRRQQAAVL